MRVIGKHGKASLVEYEKDGVIRRCLLPKPIIRQYGNNIPGHVLSRGIEIGVEVEDAFGEIEMPEAKDLLDYVRRKGFWTSEDILGNVSRFKWTLVEALGAALIKILRGARKGA